MKYSQIHQDSEEAASSIAPSLGMKTVEEWVTRLASDGREDLSIELSALVAIFDQSITCRMATQDRAEGRNQGKNALLVTLLSSFDSGISGEEEVTFSIEIEIPEDYPQSSPPRFRLGSKYLGPYRILPELHNKVHTLYQDGKNWSPSESVLFDAIESIKELAVGYYTTKAMEQLESRIVRGAASGKDTHDSEIEAPNDTTLAPSSPKVLKQPTQIFTVFTSEPIVDRKSVFVGHATCLTDPLQVASIMDQILSDKKVSRAAHNMFAWRCEVNGHLHQDNDDDGESAAGSRMQHLLSILDVKNVFVCVSRWFGGIHLGPDRFKHINQATRDALIKGQFISSPTHSTDQDSSTKSRLRSVERKK